MIQLPQTISELQSFTGELRAGGTDLMERRKSGRSTGNVIDLRDMGWNATDPVATGFRVQAMTTIADVARNPQLPRVLTLAAGALATPQIRAVGTLGGNLFQRVRCWYYREPQFSCYQSGGTSCLAREGDHLYHNCFDTGGCVAPHPSTLACALLTLDAQVETDKGVMMPLIEALRERPVVVAVHVPTAWENEKAAYFRSISRVRAEWPLVEASVRLQLSGGVISQARIAIGGVATMPLRREEVERALIGQSPTPEVLAGAAEGAIEGAKPLSGTAYKIPLLSATVLETLERALEQS